MKLKEVDSGFGTSLGRIKDFGEDQAKAILAGQEKSGIVCWEVAPEDAELSDGTQTAEPVADPKPKAKTSTAKQS